MDKKYIVQKYFILLLEVIIQMWDSDEFLFPSVFQFIYNDHLVPSYLQKILALTLKEEPR